jgi:tripartite-type tricarboxylate transporter receptor subunit TctC
MNKKILACLALTMLNASSWAAGAPFNLVVAFPPGGPADRMARLLAEKLTAELDRPVIVENRPGASGAIAASYVARAKEAGDVAFFSNGGALTINPAVQSKLSYDPARDFKPVSLVADCTTVLVTGMPTDIKDAKDLVRKIKQSKEPYTAGSSGVGGASHLSIEMFDEAAGVKLAHIPYRGASPVFTDLIGHRIQLFFGDLPGVYGLIQGGQLKVLGIVGDRHSSLLPGIQTLKEQGIEGVAPSGWYGVVMSNAATDSQVANLNAAIARSLARPDVAKQLETMGAVATPSTPAEFGKFLKQDSERWAALAKRRNIVADLSQ